MCLRLPGWRSDSRYTLVQAKFTEDWIEGDMQLVASVFMAVITSKPFFKPLHSGKYGHCVKSLLIQKALMTALNCVTTIKTLGHLKRSRYYSICTITLDENQKSFL